MDSGTFQSELSKFPDKNENPIGWNQAWENYLEDIYKPLPEYPDLSLLNLPASVCLTQAFLSTQDETRRELCKLQFDLAKFTKEKRLLDNFDKKWRSYPSQTRQQHLLQGLVNTCAVIVDMEERRHWCPETRMLILQQDQGAGFLNLLATVCPPGVTRLRLQSEPVFISHPIFDAMIRIGEPCPPGENKDVRRVVQRLLAMSRNSFICYFLWCTMLHLYGQSEIFSPTRVAGDKTRLRERGELPQATPMAARAVKLMKDEMKQCIRVAQWHCTSCAKPERDLLVGEKFLVCSKCQAIGRKVIYCNRQCQLNNWKKGSPPHKNFCGKPLDLPENLDVTPLNSVPPPQSNYVDKYFDTSNAGLPPPDPGFVRSAALEHQISLLRECSAVSYFLIEPYPKPDHGVLLRHPISKSFFQNTRNKAMKNGDPHSVGLMYDFLQESVRDCGFSDTHLAYQLSQEYGVSVDSLSATQDMLRKDREASRGDKTMEFLMEGLGLKDY